MAYTVADFIKECENWEYSQEAYELKKECMELELMEQYLENQRFAMECAEYGETFTEGFLMESDNKEILEAVQEKSDNKKKNIFIRIWEGFIKICRRGIKALKSLFHRNNTKTQTESKHIMDIIHFNKIMIEMLSERPKTFYTKYDFTKYLVSTVNNKFSKYNSNCYIDIIENSVNTTKYIDKPDETELNNDWECIVALYTDNSRSVELARFNYQGYSIDKSKNIKIDSTNIMDDLYVLFLAEFNKSKLEQHGVTIPDDGLISYYEVHHKLPSTKITNKVKKYNQIEIPKMDDRGYARSNIRNYFFMIEHNILQTITGYPTLFRADYESSTIKEIDDCLSSIMKNNQKDAHDIIDECKVLEAICTKKRGFKMPIGDYTSMFTDEELDRASNTVDEFEKYINERRYSVSFSLVGNNDKTFEAKDFNTISNSINIIARAFSNTISAYNSYQWMISNMLKNIKQYFDKKTHTYQTN